MRTVARGHSGRWLAPALGLSLLVAPLGVRAQQAVITGRVSAAESNETARRLSRDDRELEHGHTDELRGALHAPQRSDRQRSKSACIRVGYQEQKKSVTVAPGASVTLDFSMKAAVDPTPGSRDDGDRRTAQGRARQRAVDDQRVEARREQRRVEHGRPARREGAGRHHGSAQHDRAPRRRFAFAALNSLSLEQRTDLDHRRRADATRARSARGVGGTNVSFLNTLSPEEIEDIEIVKGPSAATLYGTDAANGVIVITTKKGQRRRRRAGTWFARARAWSRTATTIRRRTRSGDTRRQRRKVARCQLATMTPTTCVVRQHDVDQHVERRRSCRRSPTATNTNYGVPGERRHRRGSLLRERRSVQRDRSVQDAGVRAAVARTTRAQSSVRDEWMHPEALQRQNIRANLSAALSPSSISTSRPASRRPTSGCRRSTTT